jgi:uncharacterized membrane protein
MTSSGDKPGARISSIDIVRGAVMVLMAIDHVRVYSGLPAGGPSPAIFFTRWVTHFCAPVFALFAGTGAYLYGRKLANTRALARFLLGRGFLLVLLEMTVIRLEWTFNLDYGNFALAGVIWMLGWCMVLLAGLVWLPVWAIGAVGLAIIFLQKIFAFVPSLFPPNARNLVGPIWEFIYPSGSKAWPGLAILYVLVPWIGVMAAGYGLGAILLRDRAARCRLCLAIGLSAIALFLVIGSLSLAPAAAGAPPVLLRLLNQQKYPASPLYLLMTLGPAIACLPLVEQARGWLARILATFGRVPMFYYLLHILAIHIAALVVNLVRVGSIHPEWYAAAPFTFVPAPQRWTLPLLYLVWAVVVTFLYFPCRWFAGLKDRNGDGWWRYI